MQGGVVEPMCGTLSTETNSNLQWKEQVEKQQFYFGGQFHETDYDYLGSCVVVLDWVWFDVYGLWVRDNG